MKKINPFAVSCIFATILLFCFCLPMEPKQEIGNTGTIAPRLLAATHQENTIFFDRQIAPSLHTILFSVTTSGETFRRSFPFDKGYGLLDGIPAGPANVMIEAKDSMNTIVYSGNAYIEINSEQTARPDVVMEVTDPSSPYLLIPEQRNDGSIQLTWKIWENPGEIASFDIMRSENHAAPYHLVTITNASQRSYIDLGDIAEQITYTYSIRTIRHDNSVIHGNKQAITSFARSSQTVQSPYLQEPYIDGNYVRLTWTFPSTEEPGISGFEVKHSSDGGMSWTTLTTLDDVTRRTFNDYGYLTDMRNDYQICALSNGSSSCSNMEGLSTGSTISNPLLDSPIQIGGDVQLTWTFPDYEEGQITGFDIKRTTDGFDFITIYTAAPGERRYNDNAFISGAQNDYIVCARGNGGAESCSGIEGIFASP
ncbi:MAG: hypothetical protein GF401_21105 [Chitinivibrionales bacterium]|nr:hypothetical protein [Chitinivibrionales bacterium]